jgi:hypothetical protein
MNPHQPQMIRTRWIVSVALSRMPGFAHIALFITGDKTQPLIAECGKTTSGSRLGGVEMRHASSTRLLVKQNATGWYESTAIS